MEKINVVELLKDCPRGMELDCTICNGVKFIELNRNTNFPIVVRANNGYEFTLTKYGQVHNIEDAKCVIFPKGKTTWEGFQRPFKDGDIVVCDSCDNLQLFIFKEYIKEDYATCHMMLGSDGIIYFSEGDYYITRLATEEEKRKLFDAIKDNGYKWNCETKTLEKLIESAQATTGEDEGLVRDLSYATDQDLIREVLSRRLVGDIIEALTSWMQDILFNEYGYFKKED